MVALALLLLPVITAIMIMIVPPSNSRRLALIGSIISFFITAFAYSRFLQEDIANLSFDVSWASAFGIRFNVGMDGISLILVLLTGILYPVIIASTAKSTVANPKAFYSLIMLMQLGLMGVFMARDAFLFYVFYELTLIPIYFICAIWGGARSIPITLKFFIYTLAGSLLMLIAIIYLYFKTPDTHTFDIQAFYQIALTPAEQGWIFWAFFLAFAVKIPVFPFHSWQPDTYTVSPVAGTMLLAGLMLKMGIYGLIRFVLPLVPLGLEEWIGVAMVLCIIGIVYASLIAWQQQDLKRLLAYSSIAHVGLITAGVLTANVAGLQGAMIQMFNHGINVVGLFFMVDIIERRYGTRWMDQLGGIAGQMKKLGVYFMIVMLGSVGLPLTNGFVGEFMLLLGIYEWSPWAAAFAGLTLILGAVYMFRLYRNVFLGDAKDHKNDAADVAGWEQFILISLCVLVLVIGIFPSVLLEVSLQPVQQILHFIVDHKNGVSGL